MKSSKYALSARIIPAVLTIILPIIIFNHFFVSEEFSKFLNYVFGIKLISNIGISLFALYFLSQLGRIISKQLFQFFYYKDELNMPTTEFMLYKHPLFSDAYKDKVREKVKNDFGMVWLNKDDEKENELIARKYIVETMALIRKKLHGNSFLLQHNIEYGAIRNAIGGAVLGSIFSVINILFFKLFRPVEMAVIISICTLTIYVFLILFSKRLIDAFGNSYAKILFREYMGEK
jgi:hypothetical protein